MYPTIQKFGARAGHSPQKNTLCFKNEHYKMVDWWQYHWFSITGGI